jgi:hypothetical protein
MDRGVCVRRQLKERRGRPPMLLPRTIEVTLPISPHSLLLVCWEDFPPYKAAALPEVDNANRLQSIACTDYIVVRRDETKLVWFT